MGKFACQRLSGSRCRPLKRDLLEEQMVSRNDTYDVRRQLFRFRGLFPVSRRDWVQPANSRLVRFVEKAHRKILERAVAGRTNRPTHLFLWNCVTGWTYRTLTER
jgi:hypothetical protein